MIGCAASTIWIVEEGPGPAFGTLGILALFSELPCPCFCVEAKLVALPGIEFSGLDCGVMIPPTMGVAVLVLRLGDGYSCCGVGLSLAV